MNSTIAQTETTPPGRGFHIQDNGNALWMMTAVLLAAGYVAIRTLTGAADAPQVEVSKPGELIGVPSPSLSPSDGELHKLRPKTLQGDAPMESYPLPVTRGSANSPAVLWDNSALKGWQDPAAKGSPGYRVEPVRRVEHVGAVDERERFR